MRSILIATLALLLAVPASAASWRPPVESRLGPLEADLAPVMRRVVEIRDLLPSAAGELVAAAYALRTSDIAEAAAAAEAAVDEAQAIAVDGLAILDRYGVEPCYADYAGVVRSGLLILGDIAATRDPTRWSLAMYLLLPYAGSVRSVTVCA